MADIRKDATVRDDFNRSGPGLGANWATVDTAVWTAMEIVGSSGEISEASAGTSSHSRWVGPKSGPFDGDDAECWGWAIGGNAGGAAWGIGLMKDPGSNTADGYRFRNSIAGASDSDWLMEKYTNGSRTVAATNVNGRANGPFFMLIRRNGTAVEGWSSTDGITWNLEVTITDTTYTTGLYLTLASSDNSSSQLCRWDYFGGGPVEPFRPQIIRLNPDRKLWTPS